MQDYIWASKFLGCRFDLVQAGGGNTSFKDEAFLYVKGSGLNVGEVSEDSGFSILNLESIRESLWSLISQDVSKFSKKHLEKLGSDILTSAHLKGEKPSIETFLHALFKKHTLHTHPISISSLASSYEGFEKLKKQYPTAYFCEYATPGIELVLSMSSFIHAAENQNEPVIIFLRNHGLIVSSDSVSEALTITTDICREMEVLLGVSYAAYRNSSVIFERIWEEFAERDLLYPILDMDLNRRVVEAAQSRIVHFTPDIFVYIGRDFFLFRDLWREDLHRYKSDYGALPSVFILSGVAYIRGKTFRKLKEMEDILRFYFLLKPEDAFLSERSLPDQEIEYLSGWEAEKFRKNT